MKRIETLLKQTSGGEQMHMVDKFGHAVAIGVRRCGPLTARCDQGKPLPLELVTHPQRAERRRLKGRTDVPEGYGNESNPTHQVMGLMVGLGLERSLSFLKTTGRYHIEVDGLDIGATDQVAYALALTQMMGTKAKVIE